MDGIIEIKVNGNSISKDNDCAGAQYESNSTVLRISFAENWEGFRKIITFWNARGENPVKIQLGTDRLEDGLKSGSIYLVPIPGEAMSEFGLNTFVIEGFIEGVLKRTVEGNLKVLPSRKQDDAGEPEDPTPTLEEQLGVEIETIKGSIDSAIQAEANALLYVQKASEFAEESESYANEVKQYSSSIQNVYSATVDAKDSALKAEEGAKKARTAVEGMTVTSETLPVGSQAIVTKSTVNGVVNLHLGIPGGESSVYIGNEPPTDPGINVWIDTDGEADDVVTHEELEEALANLPSGGDLPNGDEVSY